MISPLSAEALGAVSAETDSTMVATISAVLFTVQHL